MTQEDANAFARRWIADWNAHDLDAILAHYAPDAEFLSPVAQRVTGAARVIGSSALRNYWTRALAAAPELHFQLIDVLVGASCMTVIYRNHRQEIAAETLELNSEGRAVRAFACYRPASLCEASDGDSDSEG